MEYTYEIGLGMANILGGAYPETFSRNISLIMKNGIIHGGPENLRAATMFLCLISYRLRNYIVMEPLALHCGGLASIEFNHRKYT